VCEKAPSALGRTLRWARRSIGWREYFPTAHRRALARLRLAQAHVALGSAPAADFILTKVRNALSADDQRSVERCVLDSLNALLPARSR